MQHWFEALLGIFNARILRLDDFFPSDYLENLEIVCCAHLQLRMIHRPHQK